MPLPLTEVIVAGQTGHVDHHNTIHDVVNRVEYFDTGVYTESFNKSDSDILGPDLTWTELQGDVDVVSNQAEFASGGTLARAEVDFGSPDHFASMSITQLDETHTNARKSYVSVMCRKDATTTRTLYEGRAIVGGVAIEGFKILKRIADVETTLATVIRSLPAMPFTIRLEAQGTSLRLYVNGVLELTITDSSITTGNYTGMRVDREPGATTAPRVDTFQAGAMASVSSFPTTADVFTDGTQSSQFQGKVADALVKVENAYISGGMGQTLDTGIFTESFNKSDSDTLGPDLTWTELLGDTDVVSNSAEFLTPGHMLVRADVDLGSPDHFAAMTVSLLDTAQTDARKNRLGVVCRKDNTSALTYYEGRISRALLAGTIQGYQIYKRIAGTETLLWESLQTLPALPFTIKLEVEGTSLRFWVNDVLQQTITDSSITTGNHTGIKAAIDSSPTIFPRVDSFQAAALSSLSAFPRAVDVFVDGASSSTVFAKLANATPKMETALIGMAGAIYATDFLVSPSNSGATNRINLQAAITAAVNSGKPLVLPPGNITITYDTSNKSISVGGKLRMVGAGRALTTLTVNPAIMTFADLWMLNCTGAGDCHLSDFTVQGPTAGSGNDALDEPSVFFRKTTQGDVTVERVQVKGNIGGAFTIQENGFDFTVRLTDCKITAYGHALGAFEGTFANRPIVIVDGCEIHDIEALGTSPPEEPDNIGFYIHPHFQFHCTNTIFRTIPRFGVYMNTGTGNPAGGGAVHIDNCSFLETRGIQCTKEGPNFITNSHFRNSEIGFQSSNVFVDNCEFTGTKGAITCAGGGSTETYSIANTTWDLTNNIGVCIELATTATCRFVLKNLRFKNTGTSTGLAIKTAVSGSGPIYDCDGINITGNWDSGIFFTYLDKARIRNLTTNITSLTSSGRQVLVGGTINELDIDGMHLSGAATQGAQMELDSPSSLLTADKVLGKDWRFTGASTAISFVGTVGQQRVIRRQGVAPTAVASAATLNLYNTNEKCSHNTFRISGTTTIDTITPGPFIGPMTLIATGAWITSAAGNIKAKSGAARTVDQAYTFHFDPATTLWYEVA